MIKNLMAILLLLPAISMAQPIILNNRMLCNETRIVLSEISKSEHKEVPLWIGEVSKEDNIKVAIVANEKTGSWTLLQYNEVVTCIMAVGEGFRFADKKKSK